MENTSDNFSLSKVSTVVGVLAALIGIIVSLHTLLVHPKPPYIGGTWAEKSPGVQIYLDLDNGNVVGESKLSAMCFADGSTRKNALVFKIVSSESRWDGQTLELTLSDQDRYVKHYKLRFAGEKLVGTQWMTHPPFVFQGTQVEPEWDEPHRNAEFERDNAKPCPGTDPNYWKNVEERMKQLQKK